MASQIEKLLALERRLFAVEKALGITPPLADLVHPKAWRQEKTRLSVLVSAQEEK